MKQKQSTKAAPALRILRLSKEADHAMRTHYMKKGDVTRLVNDALLEQDLLTLKVLRRNSAPHSGREEFFPTSAKLDAKAVSALQVAAAALEVSETEIIDAALIRHYKGK